MPESTLAVSSLKIRRYMDNRLRINIIQNTPPTTDPPSQKNPIFISPS